MFTSFAPQQLSDISLKDKRFLVIQLKEAIKADIQLNKSQRVSLKMAKDIAKRDKVREAEAKVVNQIKAAQEKLAKLQARLTA